jgi:tryptophan 7-halogenase
MGFKTEVDPLDLVQSGPQAARFVQENASLTRRLLAQLPATRELLRKIHEHGMQTV